MKWSSSIPYEMFSFVAACDPFRMERPHTMQRHDAGSLGIPQGDSRLLLETTFTTTSL